MLVLDCTGVGTDPSMTLRSERPTGETVSEVEVEGATDACCVRSSVAKLAECPFMQALRSDISSLIP